MTHFELNKALRSITVLVDTREQDTPSFRKRLEDMGLPTERRKLAFGDYSIKCQLPGGGECSLEAKVSVERKMDFSELARCYCTERARFTREFERAEKTGAKIYLLVENASWEKAYSGEYRSNMSPEAFVASIQAWLARYQCQVVFCQSETSGRLIRDLLFRELKEHLMGLEDEDCGSNQAGGVHAEGG